MRENQNIAHCSVCSEKTHCRFSHAYIPHRLHSTESNFQLFLSQNLPNNMGNICMILIQNGRRFITHSPTISSSVWIVVWMEFCYLQIASGGDSTKIHLPIQETSYFMLPRGGLNIFFAVWVFSLFVFLEHVIPLSC